jgi:hypothetical protein
MTENTTRRKSFKREMPEDVRDHIRAAREELRESIKSILPPGFMEHRRNARREMLLAWRSLIDSALDRMDEKEQDDSPANAI